MELLGQGRMAEVFAYGEGLVVKLDRPEWSGIAEFEAEVLHQLFAAGLPVPRCQGVVTIDGRTGMVIERIDGGSLLDQILLATPDTMVDLAASFVDLRTTFTGIEIEGLPPLIARLDGELELAPLADGVRSELTSLLHQLDDGRYGVCHFDFHPLNILTDDGTWKVIDWLTVASGPPIADVMRTLLIWARQTIVPIAEFMAQMRTFSVERYGIGDESHDGWLRVLAGCRLAEGFEGEEAAWLASVAAGDTTLYR